MDEGDGLENRCTCKRTVGSNPTPSAISVEILFVAISYMDCNVSCREQERFGVLNDCEVMVSYDGLVTSLRVNEYGNRV